MRNRGGWTKEAERYLESVQTVLENLKEYWPLTLRQVFYQLVAGLEIDNTRGEYQKLSKILTKARIDGLVEWAALEDRARAKLDSSGWGDKSKFIDAHLDNFLWGYRRDLLQSQSKALEVWVEKDALSRVCHRAAFEYCVPVVVARGFSSISYVNDCRCRVEQNAEEGKETVILYFGDLDPSGWEMLPAMMETLTNEMGLDGLVYGQRCALTPYQVEEFSLPKSLDAMKNTDTRTPKFKKMLLESGHPETLAVELDALPPATLETLVRDAIESNLDLSLIEREKGVQQNDKNRLESLREEVQLFVLERT
jgi:hypothetical protein